MSKNRLSEPTISVNDIGDIINSAGKVHFTSDHHFGHDKVLVYEPETRLDKTGKTFSSCHDMDDTFISKWNEVVEPEDLVIHCGDFSFKREVIKRVLPQLNGKVVLVIGNHEPWFKRSLNGDMEACREEAISLGFANLFQECVFESPEHGKFRVSHLPYHPRNENMESHFRYGHLRPKAGNEVALIHGHIHSQWRICKNRDMPVMINVGVDVQGMAPVSFDEVIRQIKAVEQVEKEYRL